MTDIDTLVREAKSLHTEGAWRGTFREFYNDVVRQDPSVVETSHQRLYKAITRHGTEVIKTESDPRLFRIYGGRSREIIRYHFFDTEFYGIDLEIMRIMEYLKAAASRGEESRQILYLVGPVGSGKTSIVERMKKALELSGPFYALAGCPMHERPLRLIPQELRPRVEEALGLPRNAIEGAICPVCRQRLKEEFKGEFDHFPMETVNYSAEENIGIGVLPPADENSMDVSLLIGRVDLGRLSKFQEHDPRVLIFDGALNRGENGLTDLYEMNKNPTPLLLPLLSCTQERRYRAPGQFPMLSSDTVLVAHSNQEELDRFTQDPRNAALRDRMIAVKIRYTRQVSAERKIVDKIVVREADFRTPDLKRKAHIAPGTIEVCALFTELSRLAKSEKVDPLTKLKLYDGQQVIERSQKERPVDILELYDEAGPGEGLIGLSTRFGTKAMGTALARAPGGACVTPVQVLEVLSEQILNADELDPKEQERLDQTILKKIVREYYLKEILREHISFGFLHAYKDMGEGLWQEYLQHVTSYNLNKEKFRDRRTGELIEPSEEVMGRMEEAIGMPAQAKQQKDQFRAQIATFALRRREHGQTISFEDHEQVREAVKRILFSSVEKFARVISRGSVMTADDQQRYDQMVERLQKEYDYCPVCVEVVLRFAHNQGLFKETRG